MLYVCHLDDTNSLGTAHFFINVLRIIGLRSVLEDG